MSNRCRLCQRDAFTCAGWLARVNPVGELPAVWECRPCCDDMQLTTEDKLLGAIEETARAGQGEK